MASISGAQSSVSIVDLPPSKQEKLSSSIYTPKIFRCSLYLAQRKTKCSLDSIASPHSQRFDSTALMLCRHPFSGGCYSRAELRENARLSLAEVVVHASSVISRPGSVDSAYQFPDSRRYLLSRSSPASLCPLNHTSGQPGPVSDHSSFVRGLLRQLLCLSTQLEDRAHRGPCEDYAVVGFPQTSHMFRNAADDPLSGPSGGIP